MVVQQGVSLSLASEGLHERKWEEVCRVLGLVKREHEDDDDALCGTLSIRDFNRATLVSRRIYEAEMMSIPLFER